MSLSKVLRTHYDAFSLRRKYAYRFRHSGPAPCVTCGAKSWSEWPVHGEWQPACSEKCAEAANAAAQKPK